MKCYLLAFCLAVFSQTICAQQADPCTALSGSALERCQVNQQKLQQQQLTEQQKQLTQLQQQLAQQQQQLAQQQEQLKQQQEQLKQQQEHEKSANQPAASVATDAKREELRSWKADNPWFGSDYARTQLAMRYAKQLQGERPDLVGRPFLDAISAKVKDTFDASK
jgi:TolA-binding protein